MRPPRATLVNLLLLGPSLTTAAPHDTAQYTAHGLSAAGQTQPLRPWRRLSDAIVRRIWGLPEKQTTLWTGRDSSHHGAVPDGKLRAQYGEDMVVRFNLSTADEASALAQAADTLFLDIWEFNEDWVDIRIAKHVVSGPGTVRTEYQLIC
jgi:extracellular matrix protein 14